MLLGQYYSCLLYKYEETKVQRNQITFPRVGMYQIDFNPTLSKSHSELLWCAAPILSGNFLTSRQTLPSSNIHLLIPWGHYRIKLIFSSTGKILKCLKIVITYPLFFFLMTFPLTNSLWRCTNRNPQRNFWAKKWIYSSGQRSLYICPNQ
jgi:hypothetical protein